jgi:hypothetical protein
LRGRIDYERRRRWRRLESGRRGVKRKGYEPVKGAVWRESSRVREHGKIHPVRSHVAV